MEDILESSKCEGCGVYPGQSHKDGCWWLKKSSEEARKRQKIRDMVEEYIDIDGIVERIINLIGDSPHRKI
jgi:hypothetical protein